MTNINNFVQFKDFDSTELDELSEFVGRGPNNMLINIETLVRNTRTVYRVWYYNV